MTAQNKFIKNNIADNSHLVALQELIDVVAKLRSPEGGCPWDLAQTQTSLTPYIIEEAYEVLDAISTGEQSAICEELGDLLLQVILQAQIASEKGDFSIKEVAEGIAQKLIRRHPHVFGDVKVENVEQVRQNWDEIKAAEKGQTMATEKLSDKLNRYRRSLPPLNAAMKISQKAAEVGFEWSDIKEVWDKFHEELAEFDQALAGETPERQESELGDLLFAIIQLARWYNLDPVRGLAGTSLRFVQRLRTMEQVMDRPISDYKLAELEALWQQAKAKLIDG
ncbi:nucleoside triphosphate pyrophosphohydrolase [Cylindrospermopsis raciborskii S07]|uniref:nucleoside triphosphate pyrophosphohydrolase n=1 Tax=Cylindrospermopsis raciborskii TaxID=77022 RepID=UPI000C9DCF62|nr:nucleoside triphosphate pyrophosphohydrolase [Cylindrospermopsis raciborskii]PNK04797.1 nucleoside triphosphate pyrophosphohydrolase [Cylindrospermopsis raciborskii S07]PNK06902.1 nucleoside triphosphate pyrophosphohydrolase [Cylindrospermopsis raciborskii S10]PNK10990.1 nucleoside triphosphate pyrophosphohydrolase [Cylindrospermopsis raciborskii S14]PNK11520.1 nucleoside triphosphate pyrophosphohydrolase [Cylindrospermopsis raciborskii S06]PNK11936.1 nucleoside triphosphate pyrophosphohydr